ncbi:hypothetical protein ACUUL3_10380 [Thiovibrio sp. JS02]
MSEKAGQNKGRDEYPCAEHLRLVDRFFNPSIENLISKYLEYANRVDLLCREREEARAAGEGDGRERALRFCEDKLREIRALLFPPSGGRSRTIAAWQLLHRVSEEMILLMSREELLGFGLRLKREISTMTMPEVIRKEWADLARVRLAALEDEHVAKAELRETRQLFLNIYRSMNGIVDDQFWDLWVQKFLAVSYTVALALLTALFLVGERKGGPCLSLDKVLLLGAMGGLMSGVFTGARESMPKGHFWTPTLYYLLVRPLMGLLAALAVFWAVESQFLVAIEPPYPGIITTCEVRGRQDTPAVPEIAAPTPTPATTEGEVKVTPVTMKARAGREHYLYMLLFLCAGFAGDKLLKAIADRVTAKLISQAEKSKESKE